ncbi:MAG: 16S rRNA (guanine(966)-N(2))-methyltransferase RsmD [Acholeplasmataceae bacterium]|jgi:16S rRNA (guanine(966)-N(2))-methyltransferase RsmD|nr:16S rRNA (guanine(966)-N(2))-methyltransferase RsmD [Acholeplasmataceae bacterium]
MRIIGGTHRGRILERVGKDSTRESADMVKLAVFNMIGVDMHGVVLDLFAGSGAYGLESLSRGADLSYLVDLDRDAIKTIKKNAIQLKLEDQTMIFNQDYQKFMDGLNDTILFDYIFLDPPYEMDVYVHIIKKLSSNIRDHGLVVCESHKKISLPNEIDNLVKIKEKVYGIKRVTIYEKTVII